MLGPIEKRAHDRPQAAGGEQPMVQAMMPQDDQGSRSCPPPGGANAASHSLAVRILVLTCILLALMLRVAPAQAETAPLSLPDSIARDDIPPLFPGLDMETAQEALNHYRFGRIAEGDALREKITDEAADALLEWAAVRSSEMRDFERIAGFMRTHPDWPGRGLMRLRAEQAFVETRPGPGHVLAFFATEEPRTGRGHLLLTQALWGSGAREAAEVMARQVWRDQPLDENTEAQFLLSFAPALSQADHRVRMENRLFAQDWTAAGRAARFAGEGFETLVSARRALMRDPAGLDAAIEAVPPALRNDSSLLFTQARRLRLDGDVRGAAAVIASAPRAASVIGNGDAWWVERRIVARNLLEEGENNLAYELISRHAALAPVDYVDAEFHAGWIALRFLNDPERAIPHFEAIKQVATTPISLSRADYWRGRALADLGDEEGARQAFAAAAQHVTAFYGQLAHQTLDAGPLALPPLPAIDDTVIARRDGMHFTRAIVLLHALEAEDLAIALLGDLGRTLDDAALLRAFGELAQALDNPRALLGLSRSAVLRGLPLDELAYPLGAVPEFPRVGPAVERALVYAIARQESAFDPQAVSPAGARGLMQFMPATARRVAQRYGVTFEESRLLGDPVYSAKLGAAHLGELLADWDGSAALAFAAYNAGPGHVRRWIERFGDPRRGGHDMIDWVEQIPFPETRSYVQRVMENLVIYRHRLGEERPLAIDAELRAMR
jgi:soluble lytic murein transglycosylase